jgi:dynein heavy chain
LASFVLKTFKLKADKWMKMYVVEENKTMVLEFVEKNEQNLLVFFMNASGTLVISYDYPSQIKSKTCYFAKKNK